MIHPFNTKISQALGANLKPLPKIEVVGNAELPSWFDVSDLAYASVSAAAP